MLREINEINAQKYYQKSYISDNFDLSTSQTKTNDFVEMITTP